MNNQVRKESKVFAGRQLVKLNLLISAGALIFALLLSFVGLVQDIFTPRPHYREILVTELANQYHRLNNVPSIVVAGMWPNREEETLIAEFPQIAKKQEEANKAYPDTPAPATNQSIISLTSSATHTASEKGKKIKPYANLARFSFYDNDTRLVVDEFMHSTDKVISEDAQRIAAGLALPPWVVTQFGPLPNDPAHVSVSDAFCVDTALINLEALHWRSTVPLQVGNFNEAFRQNAQSANFKTGNLLNKDAIQNMYAVARGRHDLVVLYAHWIFLPLAATFFVICWLSAYGWYLTFLNRYNHTLLRPGFMKTLFSRNHHELNRKTRERMRAMKLAELRALAKKTVKVDRENKPQKPAPMPILTPGAFVSVEPINPPDWQVKKVESLFETFQELRLSANNGELSREADHLFGQALRVESLSRQRDLFVEAIRLQKEWSAKWQPSNTLIKDVAPEPVAETETDGSKDRSIKLRDEVNRLFPVPDYLPDGLDRVMVREILVVLVDPGKGINMFGSNYRPDDRVKKRVVQHYAQMGLPFKRNRYDYAIKWLVAEGVLNSKPKTAAFTLGLASYPRPDASEAARRLISSAKLLHSGIAN